MKNLFNKLPGIHFTLALTIVLIGCLGLCLVLVADFSYQKQASRQQQHALQDMIAIKTNDLIGELIQHQKELGFVLQSENTFIDAFKQRDQKQLKFWLDQEFNRYYTTTGLMKLEKLLVYDTDFRLVSRSARGLAIGEQATPPCASLIRNISQLPVTEHLKPRSELCLYDNKPLISTVVSIGSLQPKGYIQIVSDPAFTLANIGDKLGIELKIATYDNTILHQSRNWSKNNLENKTSVMSSHVIRSSDSNPLLVISGVIDAQDFYNQLTRNTKKIILLSAFIIFLALIFALVVVNRSLLPLRKLQPIASEADKGNFVMVNEEGNNEISAPIRLFNKAVAHIQTLTKDLDDEIATHRITEEKLHQAVKQAEEHASIAETRRNFLRMTLQSVIDGVITTDVSSHVTYINPIAEQLTGWSEEDIQGKTLAQIFHVVDTKSRGRINDPTSTDRNGAVLDEPVRAILIQNGSNIETPVEYIATPMLDSNDNITGSVIIIHDESAQRSLNRQLTFQATHDAITGLPNRIEFERKLKQLISATENESIQHALCYLDIDDFKIINEKYGHTAGDELLNQVAFLLANNLHKNDLLARLGKDEFGLILEDCDIANARVVLEKILEAVNKYSFTWDVASTSINISIGITPILNSITPYNELLDNAASACCLAREDGRERLQIYAPENNKLLVKQREIHWVSRINHALEENRFQLYYHEILSLKNEAMQFVRHGEVLLRMIDRKGEVVSPNMFLPAAERYHMLGVIDEWVVEKAMEWLSNRNNKAIISINISGHSIASRDFLNFVVSSIKHSKINAELLCFEITEAAAIRDLSSAVQFMTVLKKLGCSFALDDFGSGLSSFSYLTSLPVDYLKIDGVFVMDIDKDPMHYAMVKSIHEVAHVMGIKTIAEFAASSRIIECLREIGIDYAQGYAVARPVPLSSFHHDEQDSKNITAS